MEWVIGATGPFRQVNASRPLVLNGGRMVRVYLMFEWLEKRIDPFAPFNEEETPPGTVAAFAWHYLRPVRLWLAVLFVASLIVGIFESSLVS